MCVCAPVQSKRFSISLNARTRQATSGKRVPFDDCGVIHSGLIELPNTLSDRRTLQRTAGQPAGAKRGRAEGMHCSWIAHAVESVGGSQYFEIICHDHLFMTPAKGTSPAIRKIDICNTYNLSIMLITCFSQQMTVDYNYTILIGLLMFKHNLCHCFMRIARILCKIPYALPPIIAIDGRDGIHKPPKDVGFVCVH